VDKNGDVVQRFSPQKKPSQLESLGFFCGEKRWTTSPFLSTKNLVKFHFIFSLKNPAQNGFFNEKIKWNFTKFLVDKNGDVVQRFSPQKKPVIVMLQFLIPIDLVFSVVKNVEPHRHFYPLKI
jgi:glutathione peroxidase-family protein